MTKTLTSNGATALLLSHLLESVAFLPHATDKHCVHGILKDGGAHGSFPTPLPSVYALAQPFVKVCACLCKSKTPTYTIIPSN